MKLIPYGTVLGHAEGGRNVLPVYVDPGPATVWNSKKGRCNGQC